MKVKYLGTGAAEGWPGVLRLSALQESQDQGRKNIRTPQAF